MKKLCKIFAFCTFTAIGLLFNSCNIVEPDDYTNSLYTIEMRRINGGTFNSSLSTPTTVASFDISTTEITQELYKNVMGNNPSSYSWDPASGENQKKRPVECTSFYDIIVFCNKLSKMEGLEPVYSINGSKNIKDWGKIPDVNDDTWNAVAEDPNASGFRLPHKDEFVFAALGNTASSYSGDDWAYFSGCTERESLEKYAWYKKNSDGKTHEVAKKAPNSYGLYDMSGNVWEICWDLKDNDVKKHLRLCGSFKSHKGDDTEGGNCAIQEAWDIDSHVRYNDTGFRVVKKAD